MSTYLLAIIIGRFDTATAQTNRGIDITAYVQEGKVDEVISNLTLAAEAVDFLEEYFETKYPLESLSIVSYNRFPLGAMENWGCIIFDRNVILTEEDAILDRKYA